MKICSVEGCENPQYAKTWCNTHYCRQWRTGSVEPQPRKSGGNPSKRPIKHGTPYAYRIRGCRCTECASANREYDRSLAANDPTRVRDSKRRSLYGITGGEYAAMLVEQNCLCAICGSRIPSESLFVDHRHDSGEVRGLLCRKCNSGLGMFGDDPDRLLAAATYLMQTSDALGALK